MKITWKGTACVEIVSGDTKIVFDPFVPFKRSRLPITIEDFDGYKHIFVTHGHFDHIENLPEIIKRNPEAVIHCTKAPYDTLLKKGVCKDNLALISNDERMRVLGCECISGAEDDGSEGIYIRTYQGRHAVLSAKLGQLFRDSFKYHCAADVPHLIYGLLAYPENGEILFYELKAEGKRIFLMGSLNLDADTEYPEICDLMILPYNGWDDNYPHAVEIVEKFKPAKVLADHYDPTFRPATKDIDIAPLAEYLGDKLILINQMESITL